MGEGESGVIKGVGLVDFGEVVGQEGMIHYLNIISAYRHQAKEGVE